MYPSYEYTNDASVPAIITLGEYSTPVWIQQKWQEGEYAGFVQKNGCGHTCTAMALNLNGIKITPHEEFTLCRKMWGEPRMGDPLYEDNFASASGIVKVITSFGIKAEAFGIPEGKACECAQHISDMLKEGKQVIFWSHPSDKLPDNPFSSGEHYVLAVGYTEEGDILIANSSENAAVNDGIQKTDTDTISKVLREGSDPMDFTWGRYDLVHSGGYVVVGG